MKKFMFFIPTLFASISMCFAQDKIIISEDIMLQRFPDTDHVYLHVTALTLGGWGKVNANGILLIDNGEALLIDTPWNNEQTEKLYTWLADSMSIKIINVIPTHWHGDCMGGLEFLHSKGVKSYANQMTIDMAKQKGLPIPQNGFVNEYIQHFNGTEIISFYPGGGHSTDNIVVYIPSEKILFAGCFSKDLFSQNLGNVADGDVETWPKSIDNVLKKFPETKLVIPGHGAPGGLKLLEHTKQLLEK